MNIFLLHENVTTSCTRLAEQDDVRARKQLLECCQLLAAVDHHRQQRTAMLTASGDPYWSAHPHHPITKNMLVSAANYTLCLEVASAMAALYPRHACSTSLRIWKSQTGVHTVVGTGGSLCLCRLGQRVLYVNNYREYSDILRPYVEAKTNNKGVSYDVSIRN